MRDLFLLSGSNKGDRLKNLQQVKESVDKSIGRIRMLSDVYETEPWGYKTEFNFYNQCLLLSSSLKPEEILNEIQNIEYQMGREMNKTVYTDRKIDIDILFYGDEHIYTRILTIPHPLIDKRRFVLVPLYEIAPEFVHPVLKKTINELLEECEDTRNVSRLFIK